MALSDIAISSFAFVVVSCCATDLSGDFVSIVIVNQQRLLWIVYYVATIIVVRKQINFQSVVLRSERSSYIHTYMYIVIHTLLRLPSTGLFSPFQSQLFLFVYCCQLRGV